MKVAVQLDGPSVRGSERQVVLLAGDLLRRGHRVVASCRAARPVQAELERAGVRTTGIRPRGDVDLWSLLRFAAWLHRERVDAVLLALWKRLPSAALAGALRSRARELGVEERVRFLGQRRDLPTILAAADVFVLASRRDSLANLLLAAMAAGVPVVATDTGGVRFALGPVGGGPEAGWVVPVEDPVARASALGDALAALDADPDRVRVRVAEARRRIREWLNVARTADVVEAARGGLPARAGNG